MQRREERRAQGSSREQGKERERERESQGWQRAAAGLVFVGEVALLAGAAASRTAVAALSCETQEEAQGEMAWMEQEMNAQLGLDLELDLELELEKLKDQ